MKACPNRPTQTCFEGLRCALFQALGHGCPPSFSGGAAALVALEHEWTEQVEEWEMGGRAAFPMPPSWLIHPACRISPAHLAGELQAVVRDWRRETSCETAGAPVAAETSVEEVTPVEEPAMAPEAPAAEPGVGEPPPAAEPEGAGPTGAEAPAERETVAADAAPASEGE